MASEADELEHQRYEPIEGMVLYWFVLLKRGPRVFAEDAPELERLQEAHLANIRRLHAEGVLLTAGPFLDDGDLRGILLLRAETLAEARAICASDPSVQAGRLAVEIHPLMLEKGTLAADTSPA